MLLLRRKPREKIIISEDIEVSILKADKNQVKIGIKAPREIKIHRMEVYEKCYKDKEI